jgi:photosynthetic reaction center H subunit
MTLVKLRQVDRARTDVPIDQRLLDKPGRPREVVVKSVLAQHFDKAPLLKNPDQITLLEEDKITAFFGGGHLYAFPGRQEPLL